MFVSAETFHNDVMVHESKAHVMAPQSTASSSDTDCGPSSGADGNSGGSSAAEVARIEEGGTEGDGVGVAGVASLTDCMEKVYVEVNSFLTSVINKQQHDSGDVDDLELEEEETEET
eukprot:GHVS01103198.1.p2 GENE.GHVS01103198.1~~GHVS01103198.1.p2  ORF type:complete len:117 (-),score=36.10 GHVS01103198.1:126-476(-)